MADRNAIPSRAASLPPSERALYERIAAVLDRSPWPDESVASSDVCYQLHEFRALAALERKGFLTVEVHHDEGWIRRPENRWYQSTTLEPKR